MIEETVRIRPVDLIDRYYKDVPEVREILLIHSRQVTRKALRIANTLKHKKCAVDRQFIAEAAMLHDIGIIHTHAPEIGCHGDAPYLQHGVSGARMLRNHDLHRHARVCERHTGVGLTAAEIIAEGLPLPPRDLLPETLEEKIICYADLFFSKNPGKLGTEKSLDMVRRQLLKFGADKVLIFDSWRQDFEPDTD